MLSEKFAVTWVGGLAGLAESFRPSLVPRSTVHQVLTTGANTASAAGLAAIVSRPLPSRSSRVATVLAGTATLAAVARAWQLRQAQTQNYGDWAPVEQNTPVAIAGGAALGFGAVAAGSALRRVTDAASPRRTLLWRLVAAGAAYAGISQARRLVFDRLSDQSSAPDPQLAEPTESPYVSGGPQSGLSYDTLSREGRRFVNWRMTAAQIEAVAGQKAAEPVRVFVGIEAADSLPDRINLAIAELDRLDAWSKSAILLMSPSGSGYANSVPAEALELLTNGDCAAVVAQYGLLPSMFSTSKRPLAAETFRLLLDAVSERLSKLDTPPKLFLYGESLGAITAQTGVTQSPTLADTEDATIAGVTAGLFVGTPAGASLRNSLSGNPHSVHVDCAGDLEPTDRAALFFLDHDADPVTRFAKHLLYRRPKWLKGLRGRNIPKQMDWVPVLTWEQVLVDVAYATQEQSGVFRSVGHDYRADLPALVKAAFAPDAPITTAALADALVANEVRRDKLLRS